MGNTDHGSTLEFPFRRSGVGTRYSICDNPGRIFMPLVLGQILRTRLYVKTIFGGSREWGRLCMYICDCVYT